MRLQSDIKQCVLNSKYSINLIEKIIPETDDSESYSDEYVLPSQIIKPRKRKFTVHFQHYSKIKFCGKISFTKMHKLKLYHTLNFTSSESFYNA